MFKWLKRRDTTPRPSPTRAVARIVHEPSTVAGEYELLYKYLRDRYANRVVLTFAEIEDLLGFSLPDLARVQLAWWGGAVPAGSPSIQSVAWTRAGRTATANLMARSVVFDRAEG